MESHPEACATGPLKGGGVIRSKENGIYKWMQRLARSSRERRGSRRALLEGARLVEACLRQGGRVTRVVLAAGVRRRKEAEKIVGLASGAEVTVLSDSLFRALSAFSSPSGILAVIELPESPSEDDGYDALFLDGIQDPGNLGMMLRSAAASGGITVFLSPECADLWSPKVLRAGMGAQFALTLRVEKLLPSVQEFGGEVIALVADAKKSLFELDLRGRTGFVIGSEGTGVSAELLKAADRSVTIPMPGWKEPLNAAAAGSVCLFELVRQRMASQDGEDRA
jgi:TrmH family RNA methyltransferase